MYLRESRQKRADGSILTHLQLAENVWDSDKQRGQVKILYNCGRADAALQRALCGSRSARTVALGTASSCAVILLTAGCVDCSGTRVMRALTRMGDISIAGRLRHRAKSVSTRNEWRCRRGA